MSEILHIREEDLELYAFGTLAEEQTQGVKAHVSECRECSAKLAVVLGNVAVLALAAEQETPPPQVKERLFARIDAERGTTGRFVEPVSDQEIRREKKRSRWNWNWILAPASVVLALLCTGLYRKNHILTAELREARRAAADFERQRLHVMGLVNVLSAKDTETIRLASTKDGIPGSGAVVRYNKRLGTVIYSAELPKLPAEKIYQMWLVPTSGAPINAGTFLADGSKRSEPWQAEVPANSQPKAFAVTVEPTGGVPKPTGKIILLGAA